MNAADLCEVLGGQRNGKGWSALCPAHDDHEPSLDLVDKDGRVLFICRAGCSQESVIDALRGRGLWGDSKADLAARQKTRVQIAATYDYHDEQGRLLWQSCRFEPKRFLQRRPDGNGGWLWNLDGVRRVPYRLPELLAANHRRMVLVVEGEKDVDRLTALGLVATTNAMGAEKWTKDLNEHFGGRHVVILPDNDGPGFRHALHVAANLLPVAASIRLVALPDLPQKGDVSDWLDQGESLQRLKEIVSKASLISQGDLDAWRTSPGGSTGQQRDEEDPTDRVLPATDDDAPVEDRWPAPLDEAALLGLAGEFVRLVEPHTEADPNAIHIQFLTALGNAVGRNASYQVEATLHHANEFVLIVGDTSRARKGTSFDRVRRPFELFEGDDWPTRVFSGLSSGEGLIWQVRDPIIKREKVKEKGRPPRYEDVIADPGVSDKRIFVIEGEFASTLRVLRRDGNTLSATMRLAWDGAAILQTLTKNSPGKATGAHVSIVGHITAPELRRELDSTDMGNGFANRFLFVCARRSKELPHGGRLIDSDLAPVAQKLAAVLAWSRERERIFRFSRTASLVWEKVYGELTKPSPGLYGSIIARAEAHVLRLSMIYAVLDRSEEISVDHLKAALAVWQYAEDSARYLFGESLGNPVADAILKALQNAGNEGLTRSEIRDLFDRNQSSGRIAGALSELLRNGLVRNMKDDREGRGRPAERWVARKRRNARNDLNAEKQNP